MSNIDNSLEDLNRHLPLAPQDFQVLLLLSEGPLHGYGIVKASKDESGIATLELGSLYRIVSRLTKQGLIDIAKKTLRDAQVPKKEKKVLERMSFDNEWT